MRNPLRAALGVLAFAVPIVLGVAYTAGASVGGGEEHGSSHNVDQWIMNHEGSGDFTLDREEIDGVVTLVVTGPDGTILDAADYPDFIATAAAEFGSEDWAPLDSELAAIIDGVPCYFAEILAEEVSDNSGSFGWQVSSSSDGTFAIEVAADGSIDSAYFDREVSPEEFNANAADGGTYLDMPGAEALPACGT